MLAQRDLDLDEISNKDLQGLKKQKSHESLKDVTQEDYNAILEATHEIESELKSEKVPRLMNMVNL